MTRQPPISRVVEGDGDAVLLLHGLGGDHQQSLGLLPADLAARRVAPDLPGHGDTDLVPGEQLTFAAFAQHTADTFDTLTAAGLIPNGALPVVGVSMGAGVAVALAASRPDLVAALVLIRPSWLDVAPPPNLAAFPVVGRCLRDIGIEDGPTALRATAEYQAVAAQSPAMAASLLGQFARPDAVARSRVLDDLPASLPLPDRDAYLRLDVDTLVVAAPDDPVHAEQVALTLRSWIPHARLETVPAKGLDATPHQRAVQHVVARELLRVKAARERSPQP